MPVREAASGSARATADVPVSPSLRLRGKRTLLALVGIAAAVGAVDLSAVWLLQRGKQLSSSASTAIGLPREIGQAQLLARDNPNDAELALMLAKGYTRFGHYASAREEAGRAMKLGADERQARSIHAAANMALLRYDLAVEDMRRLLTLNPRRLETYLTLSEAQYLSGDLAGARNTLALVSPRNGEVPTAIEGRKPEEVAGLVAAAYGTVGDWNSALQIARFYCRQSSGDISWRILRGKSLSALGRPAESLADIEAGARTAPNNAELQYLLGKAYAERRTTRDDERAQKCFLNAIRLDHTHGQACYEIAKILEKNHQWLDAATAYYRAYQLGVDGAIGLLRSGDLWLQHAVREEGWYRRGKYFEQIGQPQRALDEYSHLTKLHSCCRNGYIHLARVYLQMRQPLKARECLITAQRVEPARARELDSRLVQTYTDRRDDATRRALLLQLVERGGEEVHNYYFQLCAMADTAGKFDEAESWVRECVHVRPKHSGYRQLLAKLLLQRRQDPTKLKEGIRELETAVRISPEDPDAYYSLGLAYSYANCLDDAILSLRHSIDLAPETGTAYQTLSQVLRKAGKKDEAGEMLTTFKRYQSFEQSRQTLIARAKRDPKDADAWRALSRFFMRANEYSNATVSLQTLLKLKPNDTWARDNLAKAYGYLGRRSDESQLLAAVQPSAASGE